MTIRFTRQAEENLKEQFEIEEALTRAIPESVYYHNLIIVLAKMIARYTEYSFKEAVWHKGMEDKPK